MSDLLSALKGEAFSCKATLVLAVFSIFLLTTPALAWKTFYLDPKDPHFIKIEDPAGRLTDKGNRWVSDCRRGDPRPKIYFKILEFGENGGFIKFYYEKSDGWNVLHLYASKDGTKYVELWKSPERGSLNRIEIVEIPPGYKYFYFYFRDGDLITEKIILWKDIQFITLETPTPIEYVKTEFEAEEGYVGSNPPPVPTPTPTPTPFFPHPLPPSIPQHPSMLTSVIVWVTVAVAVLVIVCVAIVVVLIATKLKKTRSKKV